MIQLLEEGYQVRGTVRAPERSGDLLEFFRQRASDPSQVELVKGDLSSDEGWKEAAEGCAYVLHIASPIPLQVPKDRDGLVKPARDGALRVLKAAQAAGCKRVVMTSSIAAIGYGKDKTQTRPYTEEDWTDPDSPELNSYLRSKTLAEMAAWDFVNAAGDGLELTVINPGLILGPALMQDIGTSAEAVKQLMTGQIPMYPRLGYAVVDVRDVARSHILAMTNPEAAGQRIICAGEFCWFEDIGAFLREAYPERRVPTRRMPNWLVRLIAMFNQGLRSNIEDLDRTQRVSNDKMQRILGLKPRGAKEATLATAESLIKLGVVPK
ncbi:putative dihydroflavonol-4-reductase [Candidatus Rhodobacter oscarellae]|uniref:Putative dihydroflavonol-4-reductase n=1 Tax=Candidatus Rhodobacter oscarellae TaxID=1675527 RepID=A0A0J9E5Q2_9RHOB|nr:putative dihydroflavonol-4-reductase [Candidatus Rhodobacter lobularis]